MSKKFSQFTAKDTVADEDFINITGRTNRRISWPNFLDEVYDRIVTPFIYPTIELMKEAPLRADEDNPVYVRVEETEYRLYKITNIVPGESDIVLDNGNTATAQSEYRDVGFVVGPETSTIGALATYDNETGTLLSDGPKPTEVGVNLIEFPASGSDGYFRKKADNTVELLSGAQMKSDIGLGTAANANTEDFATAAQGGKADTAIQPGTLNSRLGTAGNLGTAAQINYSTARVELVGDGVSSGQYINCTRIGNVVTVTSESAVTHSSASSVTCTVIPQMFRPPATISNVVVIGGDFLLRVTSDVLGRLVLTYMSYTGEAKLRIDSAYPFSLSYVVSS